jgi:NADH-quinone oxidoreductase subunit C
MSEHPPQRPSVPTVMQAVPWEGELPDRLRILFADTNVQCQTYLGQNFISLDVAVLFRLISYLLNDEKFEMLTDVTAVDYPKDSARFEIIYILYSFRMNQRVRVKTRVSEAHAVPSLVPLFDAANWLEREVFDMFGIQFTGHPNLKRILMPDDWHGFPLRKDASIIGMDQEWVQKNLGIESGQ